MAKNSTLNKALSKLNTQIETQVMQRVKRLSEEVVVETAEKLADLAANKLLERATPKDGASAAKVQSIAGGIMAENSKGRSVVRVPRDSEGLAMFLEYGTGFYGQYNPHPDAGEKGWVYAINSMRYKSRNGVRGWFFRDKGTYIDEKDETNVVFANPNAEMRSWVNPHTRNGKPVKGYFRFNKGQAPVKTDLVFSAGLVPTRFMYDSKEQIRNAIDKARQSDGNQVEAFRKYLNELS